MKKTIKKIFSLIFVLALLAGCASEKGISGLSEEKVKNNIEGVIKLSDYITGNRDDGTVYYALKSDLTADYNLGFLVSVGKDTTVSLPVKFSEMESSDWKVTDEKSRDITLKPKASTSIECEKDGKIIKVFTENRTENSIKCVEGEVSRIKIDVYTKENGYKKLKSAPDFTIGNSITNKSDIMGVINVVGAPTEISYKTEDGKCNEITVLYKSLNNDWLKFVFSPDGKNIMSVDYSFSN